MSVLMYKESPVITFEDEGMHPKSIARIENPEYLPLMFDKDSISIDKFNVWLEKRSMPMTREGLREMIEEFGEGWLQNKNFASLSDPYWIKWRSETWKKVNFFTNIYSKDIGDMAFKPWTVTKKKITGASPDLTTNGVLRKRWIQDSTTKISSLVKAGSLATHQDPLSEVLVSVLVERLGVIKSAKYDLHIEGTRMCSICENMVTEDTELIPASYIYFREPRGENETIYTHLLRMCDKFEIDKAEEFLQWIIFIDDLTANEDRHLGNIFFIRDIKTGKIETGPMADNGNAYWNSHKINDAVKSNLFGDIQGKVTAKMKKKCNLESFAKSNDYKEIISQYPGITDEKKTNLIEAIGKRNNRLIQREKIQGFSR